MRVGCHVSVAGGLPAAVDRALRRGCDVFQVFLLNPRMWRRHDRDPAERRAFVAAMATSTLEGVYVHAPYLVQLGSRDVETHRRSLERLEAELLLAGELGIDGYVVHTPGGDEAIKRFEAEFASVLAMAGSTLVLLENTAQTAGDTLRRLVDAATAWEVGLCLDTAHACAAGYDLATASGLDSLFADLGTEGIDHVRLVHANDCAHPCGAHRDRHAHIGEGAIGIDGFSMLARSPLSEVPWVVESPEMGEVTDRRNLDVLRRLTH